MSGSSVSAPTIDVEDVVREIWAQVLLINADDVVESMSLFSHGVNSFQLMSIRNQMCKKLALQIPMSALIGCETFGDLVALARTFRFSAEDTRQKFERNIVPHHAREAPLSSTQAPLWFMNRSLDGLGTAYNFYSIWRFKGVLDTVLLENVFRATIARHSMLRTGFEDVLGVPKQFVRNEAPFDLSVVDFMRLSRTAARNAVHDHLTIEINKPFDLTKPPLIRATCLLLRGKETVMIVNASHLVMDATGSDILLDELQARYNAACSDIELDMPTPALEYSDYCIWEKSYMTPSGPAASEHRAFWLATLKKAPMFTTLSLDRPRPTAPVFHASQISRSLPRSVTKLLKSMTPSVVLRTALDTTLFLYTGQTDMVVGTVISGRPPGTETILASMAAALPFRTQISADTTFAEAQQRATATLAGLIDHHHMPLNEIFLCVQNDDDDEQHSLESSAHRLFQIMLLVEPDMPSMLRFGGATAVPQPIEDNSNVFDLVLSLRTIVNGDLELQATYQTALFDDNTIQLLLVHIVRVLEDMLANPDKQIGDACLLSEEELHALKTDDGALDRTLVAIAPATVESLHHLFIQQAMLRPDHLAAMQDGVSITYRELLEDAVQLAAAIQRVVAAKTIVGVLATRSFDMLTAVFGCLMAGCPYVMIDACQTPDFVQYLLRDAGCTLIVSPPELAQHVPEESAHVPIVLLGQSALNVAEFNPHTPDPDDVAYYVYTSGTSGSPKGIGMSHRNMANHVRIAADPDIFGLSYSDRIMQFFAIGFDGAAHEWFMTLCNGATLVLRSESVAQTLSQHKVSATFIMPSMLATLRPKDFPDLKVAVCGGERLAPSLSEVWGGELRLFNGYGPSETTAIALRERILPGQPITIGRPFPGYFTYCVDERLRLIPPGNPGELLIGGIGVASGYLNRPDLTAQKFISNPFGPGKLYRTGDRVRRLIDGRYEFLGRVEEGQVKVRGFRIELSGVECAIVKASLKSASLVKVENVAATARNNNLYGYVTPENVDVPTLLEELRKLVPASMVPSAIRALPSLPVTRNGKCNKSELPDLAVDAGQFVETTTDLQKQLAALWRDLLHVERVGLDDCFFRLGGHSLLVVQALARMEEMFGIRITISEAFSNSRLREIAALVEMRLGLCSKTSDAEEGPSFPLITDRPAVLPLSSAQASLWIVDYLQPALRTAYNCPLVLKMSGSLDAKALRDAFSCLIARHEVLRTSFPTSSAGTPFQQISAPTQSVSWSFSELESSVPEAETECALMTLLKKEIAKPFDLSKGPLIRVHLIDTGSHRDFVLSVLLHHIVTDAVSISNLMVEVKEIYGALTTGLKPSIRPVPQYADYALWEREWAQTAAYAQHLEFWKKSLANVPDTLQFPKDFPRSNAPPASKTAQIAISTDTCNIARALAQRASVTEFTLYFAVFQILLWRMSNQSDFVVGVPSSIRRGNRDFEQMQGYFVNTLPCRSVLSEIDAGDNNTFMDVLRLVSKSLADAREHEVPFNAILDHLKIQRSSDNSPLFQTLFILDNNRGYQQPFLLRGLTATEEVAIAPPMSKFDMSFTVSLGPSGGELWIEYNSLLFLPKRMERLGSHFCQLLGAGVTVPETQVFNLPLMSPAEMSNMIVDFNNTDQRHPIDKTVPDLIQDAVAKNPNGIALKFNGHTMSYAEVDAASNGVANQLTALGVGEGDRVGVAVNRSLQLVLLLLGILKAGAAFCPIVPSSPDDSLAGTLKDLALSVVLAEPADVRKVEKCIEMAEQTGTKVLSLKAESLGPLGGGNPKRTPLKCKADSPLYCLTTSGTTGLPKSFVFLHRNMVNLLGHFHRAYPLQQGDRVLFKTPLTFDLFAMEIFWTLTQGAAIIIAPPNAHQMVDELASLVIREKVTVATFLPAVLALFLEEIRMLNTPGAFSSLRLMLVTGEAFPADLVDAVFKVWPNIKLINGYGPGETHICTVHECVPGQSIVHIGKPIDNTYIYILDKWSQPVPIGVIGELVIGGACVGGGYINRVELTERSFVRDPLVKDKRTTCYRSSDLASYDEHGTITLFGRSDHQVKLHGVRVELVGIEAILRGLYGVKNAAVKVWNVNGVDRLTAYVVLSEHTLLDTVKMGARERLLGHSVPSLWSIMQELPLNANGKIDRKNLPSPANEKRMPETKVLTANADTQKDKNRAELLLNKPKAHVNRNLQSATLYETHKKYWMDRVEDFPDGPNLPVVNALVSGPQKLKRVRETIDTQAFAAIKTAAKQHEVSISSVIATAYSEVLSRWSNSDNFVIALKLFDFSTSVAPENRAINLCLEIDLSMGPDFLTRARSVEERLTKDMQNNLFDALAMQRALGRDREHTGRALFPCAFTCALKNNNVTTAQYEEIAGAKTQNSQVKLRKNAASSSKIAKPSFF
ncbi:hypothetical protein DFJ77DRAFT_71028 [Powellomyces hirtus]|nr:hypothetical protein DFJ77DRAFT_71028 [Powellomyces hirtus]